MTLFRSFYIHLFTWQFWLICLAGFAFSFISHRFYRQEAIQRLSSILFNIVFWGSLLLVPVVLTIPYWIDGEHSAIGTFDDTWLLLITRMALKAASDSTMWNRTLVGGTDFVFLHLPFFSIAKLYASFLSIWNEYTVIIIVNTVLMFVFCWKIQYKILGINRWLALLSSLLCALTQGFWSEGKWPDGHAAYGHAVALIPCILYLFLRYFHRKSIYLIAGVMGILFSFGSVLPLHTTPLTVMVLGIWMFFFSPKYFIRSIFILMVFLLPVIILNWDYISTTIYYLPESGRGYAAVILPSVRFLPYGPHVDILIAGLILLIFLSLHCLNLTKEKEVQKMLGIGFIFLTVPAMSYLFQESHLMPAYRWNLFYWGNIFPFAIVFTFLTDRILKNIFPINKLLAQWGQVFCQLLLGLVCIYWFLNDIGGVLSIAHFRGDWAFLTNNQTITSIMAKEKEPFRVIHYARDTAMLFLGYYNGLESAEGEANLIDRDTLDFWKFISDDYHPNHVRLDKGDMNRLIKKAKLLKLLNVKYLFSKTPLFFEDYDLVNYTPATQAEEQCNRVLNEPKGLMSGAVTSGAVMWGTIFKDLDVYWWNIKCIWNNRLYTPSLYVYRLRKPFPRIYFAGRVQGKPVGHEFEDPKVDEYLLDGNAIISEGLIDKNSRQEKLFSRSGTIKIEKYTQDSLSFHVSSPSEEQFIIMSEPNNKFWKLFIGGTEQKYHQVNIAQTGFFVPKGKSNIQYIYCPPRRTSCKVPNI